MNGDYICPYESCIYEDDPTMTCKNCTGEKVEEAIEFVTLEPNKKFEKRWNKKRKGH